jgi:hypothetical protein
LVLGVRVSAPDPQPEFLRLKGLFQDVESAPPRGFNGQLSVGRREGHEYSGFWSSLSDLSGAV